MHSRLTHGDHKIKKPRRKLTAQRTASKNNIGSKDKGAKAESGADSSEEVDWTSWTVLVQKSLASRKSQQRDLPKSLPRISRLEKRHHKNLPKN